MLCDCQHIFGRRRGGFLFFRFFLFSPFSFLFSLASLAILNVSNRTRDNIRSSFWVGGTEEGQNWVRAQAHLHRLSRCFEMKEPNTALTTYIHTYPAYHVGIYIILPITMYVSAMYMSVVLYNTYFSRSSFFTFLAVTLVSSINLQ